MRCTSVTRLSCSRLELIGYSQQEIDACGFVTVIDVIVAMDVVVQLEEQCQVGLIRFFAERFAAYNHLVLTAEIELYGRL